MKLIQTDNVNTNSLKRALWHIFNENQKLKKLLNCAIESAGDNIQIQSRQVRSMSMEKLEGMIRQYSNKIKQKITTLETSNKRLDSQIRTLSIDSKTREKLFQNLEEKMKKQMENLKAQLASMNSKSSSTEDKFGKAMKEKNVLIEKLCTQLQKCSLELKNSTTELMDKNRQRVEESIINTKKILTELKQTQERSRQNEFDDDQYDNYIKTMKILSPHYYH